MAKTDKELADEKKLADEQKLADEKKLADDQKAEKAIEKSTYIVCVTGFLALGVMFRANKKLSGKKYKDYVKTWLKEGKIRKVGK